VPTAAVGASFAFTTTAAANLREKSDPWNPAIGGFFGGAVLGLAARRIPLVLGYGGGLAAITYAYAWGGGKITGFWNDPTVDEYARKEALRSTARRPIEETIAEIGEGRGIYPPGYAERRRQRIKDRYGIDVPVGPQPAGYSDA
jgi:hypothetical protein